MEEKIKIVFDESKHVPSTIDGVEFVFYFDLIEYLKNDKKRHKINVIVDRHLANRLGFQIWRQSDHYHELMKLILHDVINEIKRRYYSETLDTKEEFVMIESYYTMDSKNNINKFPEVFGFEAFI
jgi:hypothetical protein